jgi:FG-GAP-like repeat
MLGHNRSLACPIAVALVFFSIARLTMAQVSFANPVSYKVGTAPAMVVAGDFNEDGKPDLAVVNSGNAGIGDDGGVSILLGKGDGTFEAAQNFAAGKNPATIAVADFNHDGKLDLLVSNGVAFNAAYILLGNGDGTFQAPIEIAGSGSFLSAGDLDGDGNADLAFLSCNNSCVAVLQGNGDGTFQPEVDYSIAGGTSQSPLVIGDFNGDKKLDVVVGNGSGIGFLAGNGDGTLQPPVNISFGFISPFSAVDFLAADFTSENKMDLAVLAHGETAHWPVNLPVVFLGEASGLLVDSQQTLPVPLDYGFWLAAGDVDGDGKVDLINPTYIVRGNGDGTFQSPLTVRLNASWSNLEAKDLNADGLADVVTVDATNDLVNVMLNTTPGFRLGSSPSSGTASAGGSATFTINVVQQNGFTSAISLACSGPASVGIRCSVSPASTSPGSSAQLTVTTTGSSAALSLPGTRGPLYALCLPFVGVAVFAIGFTSEGEPRKKLLGLLLLGLLSSSATFMTACGGSGNMAAASSPATPSGNYVITVTGTSGSLQRSTSVTLSVQ